MSGTQAYDPPGDCEPSWAQEPDEWSEPDPVRIVDLPDIDHYQET